MKGITAFIVGVSLFMSLPGEALSARYSDVSRRHKHAVAIEALSSEGVVKGYANGEFHPEGKINRAEAVKVLVESKFSQSAIQTALNWHHQANHSYVVFPDVPINQWFGSYVELSYLNHIVQGYPDGRFRPENSLNFAEALKIILESYNVNARQTRFQENKLLYMQPGDWFQPYFSYAYEKNLINQNKFYHPGQLITRGEFVEIIYRLETMQKNRWPEFISQSAPTSSEYTITIPKLNIIDLKVSFADIYNENGALTVLKDGLGHYLAPPDAKRKMVLFGHSSGYSWDNSAYKTILRQIDQLQNGDRVYINYKEKGYVYEIFRSNIIPASQDYTLIQNEQENEMALYTCWPPNSISHRYVVYGKPVS